MKEVSVDTCFNVDETGKHHAESKKPDKPDHMNIFVCKYLYPKQQVYRDRKSICSC